MVRLLTAALVSLVVLGGPLAAPRPTLQPGSPAPRLEASRHKAARGNTITIRTPTRGNEVEVLDRHARQLRDGGASEQPPSLEDLIDAAVAWSGTPASGLSRLFPPGRLESGELAAWRVVLER